MILSFGLVTRASHIIGGEMSYKYISRSTQNNTVTYQVTLRLYRVCDEAANIAELPNSVYFAVFSKADNQAMAGSPFLVAQTSKQVKNSGQADPCVRNAPNICFQIGTYIGTITFPINAAGYTVAFQTCCRDYTITNLVDTHKADDETNFPGNGSTYSTDIPGTSTDLFNSGPTFDNNEAVVVCANSKFSYDFSATDPNNDNLRYEFCGAYTGGVIGERKDQYSTPPPAVAPPYTDVPYKSPFTGGMPLGGNATIDASTGIITGIAPGPGKYVVTVCAKEYRNGRLFGIHKKDFSLIVTTCVREVTALMPNKYNDCSGYTITFLNNSTEGKNYDWDFGDGTTYHTTSTDPLPHIYRREGLYTVKLWVEKNTNCGDSAIAKAYVYPGLSVDMNVTGFCSTATTEFIANASSTFVSGALIDHRWDFGVPTTRDDTSHAVHPTYKYPGPGTYNAVLKVTTEMGCEQLDTTSVLIYDNPPVSTTPDTLLCSRNSLQLSASSTVDGHVVDGTYTWTPDYNITAANTATPTVSPKVDTEYSVVFTDVEGCATNSTVKIDVRDELLVRTITDSTVCEGDLLHIRSFPDGNYPLTWYDAETNTMVGSGSILDITPSRPGAAYAVVGNLGDCSGSDTVNIKVADLPVAYAGADTTICYGDQLTLRASGGAFYQWAPAFKLLTPQEATTIASPTETTQYVVTVIESMGCPNPDKDTVVVTVIPAITAFAGNDTIIPLNKPLTLHASGGVSYVWTPAEGLDNPNIDAPTTRINKDITYTVTAYSPEGCRGTDDINLRFMTGPDIYVPTAFSPNGDGRNDMFRPLPVGITQLDFFSVYDRWGALVFSTKAYLQGWDGNVNGQQAPTGTYIWVVQGKNEDNETVMHRGSVTLVR